jgi:hypothetical protein
VLQIFNGIVALSFSVLNNTQRRSQLFGVATTEIYFLTIAPNRHLLSTQPERGTMLGAATAATFSALISSTKKKTKSKKINNNEPSRQHGTRNRDTHEN